MTTQPDTTGMDMEGRLMSWPARLGEQPCVSILGGRYGSCVIGRGGGEGDNTTVVPVPWCG
jgi:hypothetical protein